jgi:signal transduction histidine kinase
LTDIVWIALIAAVPGTLVGTASLVQSIRNHRLVNSRMTELLELTKTSSKAEGVLEQKGKLL